ncbi:MAG: redoxin family protein [Alphaproteobacteria bacterium]|nr:redoxin family protein [Alphaproteobacteria bacterium]
MGSWRLAGGMMAIAALAWAVPARGAEPHASDWVEHEHSAVRLIAGAAAPAADGGLDLGLHFRLPEGWHVYFRMPGDAGMPPRLAWTGSANIADASLLFPAPKRLVVSGISNIVYEGEVVYPIRARAADPRAETRIALRVDYLVCADICVPGEADLALALDGAGGPAATAHAPLLQRFRALVPGDGTAHGLAIERIAFAEAPTPDAAAVLIVGLRAQAPLQAPDVFVEAPDGLSFAPPEVTFSPDRRTALLRSAASSATGGTNELLRKAALRLTLVDGSRSLETQVAAGALPSLPPERAQAPAQAAEGGASPGAWLAAILAALLGGLILNLMPCVLPVLALKLLAVVAQGGRAQGAARQSFLATAAGIVASFLALAVLLIGLQGAGHAVGWGIQFQEPLFLAALVLLLTLFAANLFGLLEIHLPSGLASRLAGTGQGGGGGGGLAGDFASGAFATLLATPCSAPFVGTAIGFALAGGPAEILAIFLALGLGLALPFLLVAAFPGLATRLPRPGAWMLRLRHVLGIALLVTAGWLVTVVRAQAGLPAAMGLTGGMILTVVALAWRTGAARPAWRQAATAAAAALAVAGLAAPALLAQPQSAAAIAAGKVRWQRFDVAAVDGLVRSGKTVLVDVTADWCLTCKVNKAAVLDRPELGAQLDAAGVVALQADWTRPDPAIAAYLKSFGRFGIPFNVVYGPRAPRGIVLPELLTAGAVGEAIAAASPAAAPTAPGGRPAAAGGSEPAGGPRSGQGRAKGGPGGRSLSREQSINRYRLLSCPVVGVGPGCRWVRARGKAAAPDRTSGARLGRGRAMDYVLPCGVSPHSRTIGRQERMRHMTIKVGDKMPSGKMKRKDANGVQDVSTDELFKGKTVVLFSVPGAFTPTCSAKHLPGFLSNLDAIKKKGVDTVACMAVNDAFVMEAWGKDQKVGDKVMMLADGSGDYTKALGLTMDASGFGMGQRGKRFAVVVKDGTVKHLAVEEPGKFEVSSAEAVLAKL